ncbi:purine-nucleoside phosphorylase [Weissella uvarum]|uniref:purine-nucleoside phosphorylase n=1 Tax=Weissella uvarum TaxID=1479233 RepID=UPI001960F38C|nr:purine-nucleoside phosphorylase [Weissella uvarum]MBM7617410.1 purine-nucleoside phosphorylase [Weissella uvarum]MCM0595705.1 purine-nucleoside phosphorylase [Weissella uvarum]
MTTHINAKMGDYADTVLLPGDPLRAKYIAENFLEDVVQVNEVRGALGFTGTYKGKRVSVQGSGMGIPSMSIYINELVSAFGVKTIMRVGSFGAMADSIQLGDVVLASAASTDSAVIAQTFGPGIYWSATPDFELLDTAYHTAEQLNIPVKVGNIFAADRFYNDELDMDKLKDYGVIGTEMEAAGLYLLAAKLKFRSLDILTASDHIYRDEALSAKERETSFKDMMEVALETSLKF